jgi:threonine aldolase
MFFASDNWAGAHPKIAENLARRANGYASAYGTSELDRSVEARFSEIFEREVAVFFVATGTAANSLALAAVTRPGGVAFCHREAHVIADECGAPEYLSGGGRLCGVDGALGRIDPQNLEAAIARFPRAFVHHGQPTAVSITQSTEIGTLYSLDEIDAIAEICRKEKLPLHLDGARFANALVGLDATPAEMTWKRGVDIVSFGGTKNGCWCAEAVVFMDPAKADEFPFIRKRAAQLFSKSRFVAAQFEAYFDGGLWLETAVHANTMATRLAGHIERSGRLRLAWAPQANEVFAIMEAGVADGLLEAGVVLHDWQPPAAETGLLDEGEALYRMVTSFATTVEEVDRFGALIG